jgi:hypothetical protein
MFIDRSRRPADIPAPPTPDEVAASFAVPLLTLVAQASIEEAYVGTTSDTENQRVVLESATLTYTLWRNPADRGDPINLAPLTDEMRASLDAEPPSPLPNWMLQLRARMRYPQLWEAVRTTHISDGTTWHTVEAALVEHVNNLVRNMYRDERVRGSFPGELIDPATEGHIQHGTHISIDGAEVPGMRLDTDPHVLGVAADLGDRILTAVIPREHLPYIRLEFMTRA